MLEGGLRDKPGKRRDYYHTCYCLSGLSIAQHMGRPPGAAVYDMTGSGNGPAGSGSEGAVGEEGERECVVLGPSVNALEQVEPLCNVLVGRYTEAREYFSSL